MRETEYLKAVDDFCEPGFPSLQIVPVQFGKALLEGVLEGPELSRDVVQLRVPGGASSSSATMSFRVASSSSLLAADSA